MVDITGILGRQLQIVPDMKLLDMADITLNDLESALSANNIEPGSMTVRDGYYEYNIKFFYLITYTGKTYKISISVRMTESSR